MLGQVTYREGRGGGHFEREPVDRRKREGDDEMDEYAARKAKMAANRKRILEARSTLEEQEGPSNRSWGGGSVAHWRWLITREGLNEFRFGCRSVGYQQLVAVKVQRALH